MYRDEFKNLPLSDRFMFGEVMRNSGICKLFLEELLQCKIERIVFAAKEADLSDTVLGHGIRLDVFLADENNTHYDVEMQNTSDSIEKRSRYYQSVIDRELLKRSMDYDKLPESFIIFICNFDHVGKGLAKYERVSYYKGTDDEYNDGSHVTCSIPGIRTGAMFPIPLPNIWTIFEITMILRIFQRCWHRKQ